MAEGIAEITDSSFDADVLKADKPVLVDFWAQWCGPCRAIAPVIEELAKTYSGKIGFFKCNVDENQQTPGKYGIRAIPTLMFFKSGKIAEQITGVAAKAKIEKILNKLLEG